MFTISENKVVNFFNKLSKKTQEETIVVKNISYPLSLVKDPIYYGHSTRFGNINEHTSGLDN
jgi:hypothetical protein